MKDVKLDNNRAYRKILLLIQDQDPEKDKVYFDYLLNLKNKVESKGFLFPSEIEKVLSWNLKENY